MRKRLVISILALLAALLTVAGLSGAASAATPTGQLAVGQVIVSTGGTKLTVTKVSTDRHGGYADGTWFSDLKPDASPTIWKISGTTIPVYPPAGPDRVGGKGF